MRDLNEEADGVMRMQKGNIGDTGTLLLDTVEIQTTK